VTAGGEREQRIVFSMLLPRFEQRLCFSRANFIAGPSYSAPPSHAHALLRLLPRRRIASRIGLATAEFAAGCPALEEDDGGGWVSATLPVVEKEYPSFFFKKKHYHVLLEKQQ
jgi:hypothetical protein